MARNESARELVRRSTQFLQEAWVELKKVHWPSRKEAQAATVVVIVGVLIVALYLAAVDMVLSWFMRQLLG